MRIAGPALDDIRAHAEETRPAECCGILIGTGDSILRSVRARNLAPGPNRYLIDPSDHLRALQDARTSGLEVVGFYHSHPHSAADPSPADLAEATYPECVYLIVGVKDGQDDVRLFRLRSGGAEDVDLRADHSHRAGSGW